MDICLVLIASGVADAHVETSRHRFGCALAAMTCCFKEVPSNIVRVRQAGGQASFAHEVETLVTPELADVYELLRGSFHTLPGFIRYSIQSSLGTISNNLVRRPGP